MMLFLATGVATLGLMAGPPPLPSMGFGVREPGPVQVGLVPVLPWGYSPKDW